VSADDPYVLRLGSLLALRDVELDLLPLIQAAVAATGDRAEMHEHIRAALHSDEAVSLVAVEPLHRALRHRDLLIPDPAPATMAGARPSAIYSGQLVTLHPAHMHRAALQADPAAGPPRRPTGPRTIRHPAPMSGRTCSHVPRLAFQSAEGLQKVIRIALPTIVPRTGVLSAGRSDSGADGPGHKGSVQRARATIPPSYRWFLSGRRGRTTGRLQRDTGSSAAMAPRLGVGVGWHTLWDANGSLLVASAHRFVAVRLARDGRSASLKPAGEQNGDQPHGEQRHEIMDIRLYAMVVASIRHCRFDPKRTAHRARGVA
jgi:hypothetical protein